MDIITKEIDQLGNTTLYKYDQMFNLKKVIFPNNIEKGIGTSYEYTPFHKLLKKEDAEGNIYATPRDYEGNLLKEINPNSYDIKLNDVEGISYEYNGFDNKIKIIDPSGQKEKYSYDLENRLKEKIDRNGVITQYNFNMYQNLLYRKTKDDSLQEIYIYSKDGYLENAIANGMQYNYTHDVMGRIASKSASGRTLVSYEYDKNGNKTKEIDVTGKIAEFTYNELDLLQNVVHNGNSIAKYDYYNNGLLKHLRNGNLEQSYKYDEDLNLTNLDIYHNGKCIVDKLLFL